MIAQDGVDRRDHVVDGDAEVASGAVGHPAPLVGCSRVGQGAGIGVGKFLGLLDRARGGDRAVPDESSEEPYGAEDERADDELAQGEAVAQGCGPGDEGDAQDADPHGDGVAASPTEHDEAAHEELELAVAQTDEHGKGAGRSQHQHAEQRPAQAHRHGRHEHRDDQQVGAGTVLEEDERPDP